ncbi:MAG: ABC transporter ATP-binding protein [Lachnospiraceae bacterium]|nr:ABC transporter ATP-binding protein [Lachnospiraceae bacterium]
MEQHTAYFRVTNVNKQYRRKDDPVLRNINLEAERGQCIGILGANGCGKSTLLSILAGALTADSGTMGIGDKTYSLHHTTTIPDMGYIPQENPLIDELSALDNLKLWYCNSKLDLSEELNSGVLAMLGIPAFLSTPVNQMSGGMKKRLSIGCSVANAPQILLMDEPGAALDLQCKELISSYIKNCLSEEKIVLLATHEEREIALCNTIFILKNGSLTPFDYNGNMKKLAEML